VTVVASADKNDKRVSRGGVAFFSRARGVVGAHQVTVNAQDVGLPQVSVVFDVLGLIMAANAGSVDVIGRARLLGVNLVTVCTGHADLAMLAGRPLGPGIGMTSAAQLLRGDDKHVRVGVFCLIRAVAGLARHARQRKLPCSVVIASGMANVTFPWLWGGLHKGLELRPLAGPGVAGAGPILVFLFMALAAVLGAGIAARKEAEFTRRPAICSP